LAPEVFDKAFAETPKAFYQESEKDLGSCVTTLKAIDTLCNEKFGDEAPSFGRLRIALEEVLHTVHTFLEKKRETEPDPVISSEVKDALEVAATQPAGSVAQSATIGISVLTSSEPADRREAIATVARVAASLRQKDPYNPAPYLLMRGLRWGELRSKLRISDLRLLEAPPTELRQHVKRLALDQKWAELLETCENAMSLPCGRAWLDMQRLVVTACSALGSEYAPVASAICSELRTLMNDIPELADANLLDDTPAANHETNAWLKQLNEPSAWPSPVGASESDQLSNNGNDHTPPWLARATDPYVLAQDALKAEQAPRAFDIMRKEIDRQRSGRGRFERTMQLAQLCVQAGKDTIAQPLLDDLAAAIDTHKLDDWEDPELVASALVTLMKFSKKLQSNATERQKMFERICRLDPSQALGAG
jgi:type VI secretion system protein ImpA